jgi:D-alanine-D-alanine ligase
MTNNSENRKRIAVLFGGRSGEHEVSLASARSVLSVLDQDKYEIFPVGISKTGAWYTGSNVLDQLTIGKTDGLEKVTILPDPSMPGLFRITAGSIVLLTPLDIVFPVLHGTFGEDGTLQGLLEMADLTYVGGGVLGSSVGMDKGVFKDVMRANDIPVIESILVLRKDIEQDLDRVIAQTEKGFIYPVFVKPANLGSSVGISKCNHRSDLVEGLIEAAKFDRRILVERAVNAREIEISVLGNDHPTASVAGEVLPSREFYSYESKYVDGSSGLNIPATIPATTSDQIRAMAIKAFKAIDCAGMARVDFFLDKDNGNFYLNELNSLPGFTSISMYPKLWQASGLPFNALVDTLIDLALERKVERDRTERSFRSIS